MSARWLVRLALLAAIAPLGCATTQRADDGADAAGIPNGADAAIGFIDAAMPHVADAAPVHPADAAIQPGPPDASPPGTPDAGLVNGVCSADNQCTVTHECCWKWLPPNFNTGTCTYGDVLPLFGCTPGDPPDAGP
jgi:hypothetical protein